MTFEQYVIAVHREAEQVHNLRRAAEFHMALRDQLRADLAQLMNQKKDVEEPRAELEQIEVILASFWPTSS
jgi:hypothetical protein